MCLEAREHLFFNVFDVSETIPTSDIAVFTVTLKRSSTETWLHLCSAFTVSRRPPADPSGDYAPCAYRGQLLSLETQLVDCRWGFGNIGTESPVKPSSATIAALYELFLVSNRIAQWPQFAPRYGFGHRE